MILKSMKAVMMFDGKARMKANLDPDVLFKARLLARMENFKYVQKVYFSQMFQSED